MRRKNVHLQATKLCQTKMLSQEAYEPLDVETPKKAPDDEEVEVPNTEAAAKTLRNFILMSVLFSANHGCVAGENPRSVVFSYLKLSRPLISFLLAFSLHGTSYVSTRIDRSMAEWNALFDLHSIWLVGSNLRCKKAGSQGFAHCRHGPIYCLRRMLFSRH